MGEIFILDDDILGDGVNITSQIEPLAEPRGICISSVIYDLVKKKLDLSFQNMGQHELKNIDDLYDIFKIVLPWSSN